jgi:hypothetical protein
MKLGFGFYIHVDSGTFQSVFFQQTFCYGDIGKIGWVDQFESLYPFDFGRNLEFARNVSRFTVSGKTVVEPA